MLEFCRLEVPLCSPYTHSLANAVLPLLSSGMAWVLRTSSSMDRALALSPLWTWPRGTSVQPSSSIPHWCLVCVLLFRIPGKHTALMLSPGELTTGQVRSPVLLPRGDLPCPVITVLTWGLQVFRFQCPIKLTITMLLSSEEYAVTFHFGGDYTLYPWYH